MKPKWLTEQLANGRQVGDFAIRSLLVAVATLTCAPLQGAGDRDVLVPDKTAAPPPAS